MQTKKTFTLFRKIAMIEGISFLILLFIAMPLKYAADLPLAVRIVGAIHGGLFVAFMVWMYLVYDQYGMTIKWMLKAFIASIIPFGTFWMEKEWKREELKATSGEA